MKSPLLITLFFLISMALFCQNNPFAAGSSAPTAAQQSLNQSPWLKGIQGKASLWQQKIRNYLQTYLKEDISMKEKVIFWLLVFCYGFIHAIGPGHRKVILFSWFLNKPSSSAKAALTGLSAGMIHGGSSILLFSVLYYVLNSFTLGTLGVIENRLTNLTFIALLIIGFWMLFHSARELLEKNKNKNKNKKEKDSKSLFLILISSLIPCPGASLILTFTLGYGLFATGVVAVVSMSLGMGLVLAFICVFGNLIRKGTVKLTKSKIQFKWLSGLVELSGAVLIVLFSGLMIL